MLDIRSPLDGFVSPFGARRGRGGPFRLDFMTGALNPLITFSRPSMATMFDAAGKLTFAPNNMLTNSATLTTRSVTVQPVAYILSFKGTGSVAKSGAATGVLAGTGATDRVYEKFTPSAGSVTLTVSGSVTDAQLEAVTYETTPRAYVDTGAAIYYGPRFSYNPATRLAEGMEIEAHAVNVVLHNRDLTQAAWTLTNASAAKNQTGVDGVANSASSLTATGASATCLQAITLASAQRKQSAYVKRLAGSGVVEMTTDGGTTWTPVTLTAEWARVSAPAQTLANPSVGFRLATSGDAIAVDFVQNEAGSVATSAIFTAATAVTRSGDDLVMDGTNFSSWFPATEGTIVAEFNSRGPTTAGATSSFALTGAGATNVASQLFGGGAVNWTGRDSASVSQWWLNTTGLAFEAVQKVAYAYKSADFAVVVQGGAVVSGGAGTVPPLTRMGVGGNTTGTVKINGFMRRLTVYPTRMTNAQMLDLVA